MNSLSLSRNRKNYLGTKIKHRCISNKKVPQDSRGRSQEVTHSRRLGASQRKIMCRGTGKKALFPGMSSFLPRRHWDRGWTVLAVFVLPVSLTYAIFTCVMMAQQTSDYSQVPVVFFDWMIASETLELLFDEDLPKNGAFFSWTEKLNQYSEQSRPLFHGNLPCKFNFVFRQGSNK